jgi:hypothetical protein
VWQQTLGEEPFQMEEFLVKFSELLILTMQGAQQVSVIGTFNPILLLLAKVLLNRSTTTEMLFGVGKIFTIAAREDKTI